MVQWRYFDLVPATGGSGATEGSFGEGAPVGKGRFIWEESWAGGKKRGVRRGEHGGSGTMAESTLNGSSTASPRSVHEGRCDDQSSLSA